MDRIDGNNQARGQSISRQADALKTQQLKIKDLTARLIRLEAQFDLVVRAAVIKRITQD